jgi:hypothetical protein
MSTAMNTDGGEVREAPGGRQQPSVLHLVMGLIFLGVAGSWALHTAGVIEAVEVKWVMPVILVVAGAAGLLASFARGLAGRGAPESGEK